jgi:hypothetical protein
VLKLLRRILGITTVDLDGF